MKFFESIQDGVPETRELHRITLVDPDCDASRVSVVFIRVLPEHSFPQHIHPVSEDCFFVLSGGGEVFGPGQRFPVSEVAGVRVPPGVPHGLAASPSGVVEIGFQSPPGPAVESTEPAPAGSYPHGMVVAPVPVEAVFGGTIPEWQPVFTGRTDWRYLDPQCCCFDKSQQLQALADDHELFVVVVHGKVWLQKQARSLGPISVVQLDVGESESLHALETNTLVLGVRVFAA